MKSKDFLRSKGILSNDSHHFIIDFHDGLEINLAELLEEYAQQSQPSPAGAAEGASEGMAEALAKFFAKECKVGDPLLSIIDSIYDDWKLVYDKLRIETSFSEAAIQANKFVIEKFASLSSPGSGWVNLVDELPNYGTIDVWVSDEYSKRRIPNSEYRQRDFYNKSDRFEAFMHTDDGMRWVDITNMVTHWRPLPAPPGVEDNQTKKQ